MVGDGGGQKGETIGCRIGVRDCRVGDYTESKNTKEEIVR